MARPDHQNRRKLKSESMLMSGWMRDLGPMRLLLLTTVLACLLLAPFADAEPTGWGVLSAYIAPAAAVLLVFVLLLDALMNRVFAIEKDDDERALRRMRTRTNLLAVFAILLAWTPFFYSLIDV
jgi:hypothetical protein